MTEYVNKSGNIQVRTSTQQVRNLSSLTKKLRTEESTLNLHLKAQSEHEAVLADNFCFLSFDFQLSAYYV